jgi:hypothetical protein
MGMALPDQQVRDGFDKSSARHLEMANHPFQTWLQLNRLPSRSLTTQARGVLKDDRTEHAAGHPWANLTRTISNRDRRLFLRSRAASQTTLIPGMRTKRSSLRHEQSLQPLWSSSK